MDTFWVIPLLIFGAIVSIGQKASKNATSKQEEGDIMPTPEQEDIERRIREILEGKAVPTKRDTPRSTSASSAAMEQVQQPRTFRTTVTTPHKVTSAKQAQNGQKSPQKSVAKKAEADPIKQGEIKRSEIGRIIDDFDVEKATIYAEIMKPKYEEY